LRYEKNLNEENKKKPRRKKERGYAAYDFVRVTGILPILLWMRPKRLYQGKKPKLKGAVLISANHIDMTDPVLLLGLFSHRRLHFLATKDLYEKKLGAFFFERMHCIKVDKENFSLDSFHTVTKNLKEKKAVVIFPEGGVNTTDEALLTFKSGAVLMAHRGGAPIIPVYIAKPGKWYQRRIAVIGEPFDVAAVCGKIPTMEQLDRASEQLREQEYALMRIYESRYGKTEQKERIKETV